ncbi:TniQ family protein [Rhizobium leguminosarum]
MTLPVKIVMHEHETPESRANRLSSANGFSSFKLFLSMTGMSSQGLAVGDKECIANLAKWSGADPAILRRYAATTESRQMTWRLGDAVFSKEARRAQRFRYCPECVLNDVETGQGRPVSRPYVRPAWICRAVRNCTSHRRPILETPFSDRSTSDFCQFVASNLSRIRTQASEPSGDVSLEVDAYIESRIRGASMESYLDRFEAFVAIDLCHHLGRFLKCHGVGRPFVADELQGAPARDIGFHVARRGEEAIRNVVAAVILKKRPKGTAKFLFGSLGRWLRANVNKREFSELVELFQDIAERNLPYGPGEMCFVPVRRRYLHSVHSAGMEYGLFEERIIKLLHNAGLIEKASRSCGRIYFDAERAHPILLAASQTLTSQEARAELGVSQGVIVQLLEAGLLPCVEARTGIRNYARIRVEDLREFQQRIFHKVEIGHTNGEMLTIATVCRVTMRETAEVLSALIGGNLKKVRAPSDHSYQIDRLRFDREEVFQHFMRPRQVIGDVEGSKVLKQRHASEYLRVKTATVPYLMALGLLDAHVVPNPVNRRKQSVVSVAALDAFKDEFIPVSEIAVQYDTHTNVILDALRKRGIKPIYDGCGSGVSRFVRRQELKDVLLDVPKRRKRKRKTAPLPA